MRRHRLGSFVSVLSVGSTGVLAALVGGDARAATPTYYGDLATFTSEIPESITDDYGHPGYVFQQNDMVMSAVLGETDYRTTGHLNQNLVSGAQYCAGCNGSFELTFTSTSLGTPAGINAVGFDITSHDLTMQYFAFITFADGTTAESALPDEPNFWGVSAPERIVSIHVGLAGGASTQGGYFQMDNLIIGEGTPEACPGASLAVGELTPGSGVTVNRTGTTTGAFNDIDEPNEIACWESTGSLEHVYRMVLAEESWLQIDLEGSGYDTKLALVDGCPGGEAFCAFNDDYGGPTSGLDCVPYAPGQYSVIISGADGNTGEYSLNITECSPCGNGVVDPGELCDDGNNISDDGCVAGCVPAECGDGFIYVGVETCDDGNLSDTDTCLNGCMLPTCGDGFVQEGVEGCDDQNDDNTDACIDTCFLASCGDGHVFAVGEECDDANEIDGDGCSSCDLDSVGESSSEGGEESTSEGGEESSSGAAETTTTGAEETTTGGEASTEGGSGVDTSGGANESSGGAGDDTSSSGSEGGGTSGGTGGQAGTTSGCGCRNDRGGDRWGAGLIVVVLAALRRRRRAS